MNSLSFKQLRKANLKRAKRWHPKGLNDWSVNDWLVAFGGEAGEALNAGKKYRRIVSSVQQNGNVPANVKEAKENIMKEIADTLIYADLVAARLGMSLEDAIIEKFNEISIRENMPDRLGRFTESKSKRIEKCKKKKVKK